LERFDAGDFSPKRGNSRIRRISEIAEKRRFYFGKFAKRRLSFANFKDGRAKLNAYLEDYANFADGLIELFQVSGEAKYLTEAKRLADLMIAEFWDAEDGGFFFTAKQSRRTAGSQ
jgi:uncharacterized protein YyaL (SSP411 family)